MNPVGDLLKRIISLAHEAHDDFEEGRIIWALSNARMLKALTQGLIETLDDHRLNTPPEILRAAEAK